MPETDKFFTYACVLVSSRFCSDKITDNEERFPFAGWMIFTSSDEISNYNYLFKVYSFCCWSLSVVLFLELILPDGQTRRRNREERLPFGLTG